MNLSTSEQGLSAKVMVSSRETNVDPWPYAVPVKPLHKWASERVAIERRNERTIHATFRFDGSTCTNLGRSLAADFVVALEADAQGEWRVRRAVCSPVGADGGCDATCAARADGEAFRRRLQDFEILRGKTLSEALLWSPAIEYSGCMCSAANLNHKWRNAIHAIHLAISIRLRTSETS